MNTDRLRQAECQDFGTFKSLARSFPIRFKVLIPVAEKLLRRMVVLQETQYSSMGWADHWKIVSNLGYDIIDNKKIDYGNLEYTLLYKLISAYSLNCFASVVKLTVYFSTLDPDEEVETNDSLIMKGDAIEISIAALKGHDDFTTVVDELDMVSTELLTELCKLCQTIQYLNAYI